MQGRNKCQRVFDFKKGAGFKWTNEPQNSFFPFLLYYFSIVFLGKHALYTFVFDHCA